MNHQLLVNEFLGEQDEKKKDKIRNEIIKKNIPLVCSVIEKKFNTPDLKEEKDDMIQAGLLGINKALNYYDPARGYFSTLAHKSIKDSIIVMLKKDSHAFGSHNHRRIRCSDVDLETLPNRKGSAVYEIINEVFTKLPQVDVSVLEKKFGFKHGKVNYFQCQKSLMRFRKEMAAQGIKRSDFNY